MYSHLESLADSRADSSRVLLCDFADVCLFLLSLGLDPALEDNDRESSLTLYTQWLDVDEEICADEDEKPLCDEEEQEHVKFLTVARAEYLELQRRDEHYQRRKDAMPAGLQLPADGRCQRRSTAAPRRPTSIT